MNRTKTYICRLQGEVESLPFSSGYRTHGDLFPRLVGVIYLHTDIFFARPT